MTQAQREALLDLLILSIFTDSHLSLKEDDTLQASFESVGWDALKPREIFICNSMNRARKASDSDAATTTYVSSRAASFTDAASQATALRLIQSVLAGDGITPSETAFLDRIRAAFP